LFCCASETNPNPKKKKNAGLPAGFKFKDSPFEETECKIENKSTISGYTPSKSTKTQKKKERKIN
jgi:hypothetical protein